MSCNSGLSGPLITDGVQLFVVRRDFRLRVRGIRAFKARADRGATQACQTDQDIAVEELVNDLHRNCPAARGYLDTHASSTVVNIMKAANVSLCFLSVSISSVNVCIMEVKACNPVALLFCNPTIAPVNVEA